MPTKTKAKSPRWADDSHTEITISRADLESLYETVQITPPTLLDTETPFAVDLRLLLNRQARMMRRIKNKPLPAHVVAAIGPIQEHAKALMTLLDPNHLLLDIQHALDMPELDDGLAFDILQRLTLASQVAIITLTQTSGSGRHFKRDAEVMADARKSFQEFFHTHREPPTDTEANSLTASALLKEYEADRQEFIERCCHQLVQSNNGSKKKVAVRDPLVNAFFPING